MTFYQKRENLHSSNCTSTGTRTNGQPFTKPPLLLALPPLDPHHVQLKCSDSLRFFSRLGIQKWRQTPDSSCGAALDGLLSNVAARVSPRSHIQRSWESNADGWGGPSATTRADPGDQRRRVRRGIGRPPPDCHGRRSRREVIH